MTSGANFVYDTRGPRTSPAIEVQGWIDPPLVGRPHDDPASIGLQALGFSVPDPGAAAEQLGHHGCTVLGSGPSSVGTEWWSLRDRTGVTIDLVADAFLAAGERQMRHLRLTVADLESSVPWYVGVGFDTVAERSIRDAFFLGETRETRAVAEGRRLPDEPYVVLLVEWLKPRSHGRHYDEPNHAACSGPRSELTARGRPTRPCPPGDRCSTGRSCPSRQDVEGMVQLSRHQAVAVHECPGSVLCCTATGTSTEQFCPSTCPWCRVTITAPA